MLKKVRNLRDFGPKQWVRTKFPDIELWRKEGCANEPVDICICPSLEPRYSHSNWFDWRYWVWYRFPGSDFTHREVEDQRSRIGVWDFWLDELHHYHYESESFQAHDRGEGRWLYEPAVPDDPKLCPGRDYSVYYCDQCKTHPMPWSDDEGNLVCPYCEVPGLVILDNKTLDHLERVREFARASGLSAQLERQLHQLHERGGVTQCEIQRDFAPHSFTFAHFILPKFARNGHRTFSYNGGLLYQGPTSPADGSFPSLTVSLHNDTGWFCHT